MNSTTYNKSKISGQRKSHPYFFPFQYFSANLCRCECTDREAMAECFMNDEGGQKIWDPVNCRCRCSESFRECSTGYIYDQTDTCR